MTETSQPDAPYIDPDMPAAWERMQRIAAFHGLDGPRHVLTVEEKRERAEKERAWWNEDRPDLARIGDTTFPTPHGDVPVRLLYPTVSEPLPSIVYLHGGGWVVGSLETHARAMHYLAIQTGACVVAVDYSRAPEAKFPVALEQTVAVVQHLKEHVADYDCCPERIALAGDSAGGNLAIGAALKLRETDPDIVKALALIYPVADTDFETESYRTLGRFGLTPEDMQGYYDLYLRGPEDRENPLAVPMKADLAGLPPTYVYAAGLDVLRDDSVNLDRKLREAGVPGRLRTFDGVPHAFLALTRMVPTAHELVRAVSEDLTTALHRVLR